MTKDPWDDCEPADLSRFDRHKDSIGQAAENVLRILKGDDPHPTDPRDYAAEASGILRGLLADATVDGEGWELKLLAALVVKAEEVHER
jgi:hypothetical protein